MWVFVVTAEGVPFSLPGGARSALSARSCSESRGACRSTSQTHQSTKPIARRSTNVSYSKADVRRAQLRQAAILRADFNLDTALQRIDHKIDVIEPAVKAISERAAQGELAEFTEEADEEVSEDV